MSLLTVSTKYGKIRGVSESGYTLFKGVPYAKSPVADLRWKAPQELDVWAGEYRADQFPNGCMQYIYEHPLYMREFHSNPAHKVTFSEDCLYMNIWTPAERTDEKLPVALWIHGGAYMGGYCSEVEFDGAAYCKHGVILVSIEYRCNIFGFLAHPWLSDENANGLSGNYGMLDQVAALKWVYENIEAFGGDNSNITIFGQSAGAMSVQTLVSSELTGNMISKAILQSGGGYKDGLGSNLTLADASDLGRRLIEHIGVKSLEELRKVPADDLLKLSGEARTLFPDQRGLVFIPNFDEVALKGSYNGIVDEKRIKQIPYMIGSTKDDIFCKPEEVKAGVKSQLYCAAVNWCLKNEENGNVPCYAYYFVHDLPGDDAGAFHSAELWYMFGTLDRCWRPMTQFDYALSDKMVSCWTNFMKTGDPNDGKTEWKACTAKEHFVLVLGEQND